MKDNVKIKCLNCGRKEYVNEFDLDLWVCYCGSVIYEIIK
jgi:transcription initiation factor TFIIIB Brf1 subunit/transcription initiation factor TFIIB